MKKMNFLRAALFWSLSSVESCAVTELTAQFEGKKKSFWEKNAENMRDTLSWPEFLKTAKNIQSIYFKGKESPFVNYRFGKRQFTKIPGFDDGSCLWSHLGITPVNMYDEVLVPYIKNGIVPDVNNANPANLNDKLAVEVVEVGDCVDPLEKIAEDTGNDLERFKELAKEGKKVRANWLNSVETNGGKEIAYKGSKVAFRPPNGSRFFQEVANYLKTNIVVFDELSPEYTEQELSQDKLPDKTSALNIRKKFISAKAKDTLYLLQGGNGLGLHYDVLVEQNSPVSKAIVEEMKSYVGSKKRFSKK
jgi:hypothetical protein